MRRRLRAQRSQRTRQVAVPPDFHALVPVLAARGGSGRSVVAGLLAQAFARATSTVVVDPQPRVLSPWPAWLGTREGAGLPGLFALSRPPESYEVAHAAVLRRVPAALDAAAGRTVVEDIHTYSVLTDNRPWDSPPIPASTDPAWYARVVELGGWSVGVVDTGFPATADHLRDRYKARLSQLVGWCRRPDTAPVVVAPTSEAGLGGLLQLVGVLEADGIATSRVVAVVTDLADAELPRPARRLLGPLESRVGHLVRLPHDPVVRGAGLADLEGLADTTVDAGDTAATAVVRLLATTRARAGAVVDAAGRPAPATDLTPRPAGPPPAPFADTPPAASPPRPPEVDAAQPSSAGSAPAVSPAQLAAMSGHAGWVPARPGSGDTDGPTGATAHPNTANTADAGHTGDATGQRGSPAPASDSGEPFVPRPPEELDDSAAPHVTYVWTDDDQP